MHFFLPFQAVNDPPEWVRSPGKTIVRVEEWTSISPMEVFDPDEKDLQCTVPFLTVTLDAVGGDIKLGEGAHPGVVILPVSNSSHIVFRGQSTWINQALLSLKFQPTTVVNSDLEMTTAYLSGKLEDDGSCGKGGMLYTVSVWPIDVKQQVLTPPVMTVLTPFSDDNQWAAKDDFNEDGWAILALSENVPVRLPGVKLSSSSTADRLLHVEILAINGALNPNFSTSNTEKSCNVNITVDLSGERARLVGLVDDLNCALEDGGGFLFEPSSFGLWQTFSDIYLNSTVVLAPSDPQLCRVDITATEELETGQLIFPTASVTIHVSVLNINHAPTINAPVTITATFSQPLIISGIQLHDSDMMSEDCEDGLLEVTMKGIYGNVHVPSEVCIRYGVADLYNNDNNNQKQVHLVASLQRLNSALALVVYEASGDRFNDGGMTIEEDTIYFEVSDSGYCGEGGIKTNSTTISVSVSHEQSNAFTISSNLNDGIEPHKDMVNWPLFVEMDEDTKVYLPWDGVINNQEGYNDSIESDVEVEIRHGHVLLVPGHESLIVNDDVQWTSYAITTTKNLSSEESAVTADIVTDEIQYLELRPSWSHEIQQVQQQCSCR